MPDGMNSVNELLNEHIPAGAAHGNHRIQRTTGQATN